MIYIEVILSKFIYYSPNTVFYKISDLEFLFANYWKSEGKISEEWIIDSLIGRIVIVPFGEKKINALIVNVNKNEPKWLKKEKIKDILWILPNQFSLKKNEIWLIFKIANYYFSTLSQTVWLFIPSGVFNPTKKDISKWLKIDQEKLSK